MIDRAPNSALVGDNKKNAGKYKPKPKKPSEGFQTVLDEMLSSTLQGHRCKQLEKEEDK